MGLDILSEAMGFAIAAHGGQPRKGDGSPMILHAMEAAAIAATLTRDPEVLAAAVLHDTVEDAGVSLEQLRRQFGERVARLVALETEDKCRGVAPELSWRGRKEQTVARLQKGLDRGEAAVVLGDKLSNMRAFYRGKLKLGPKMWELFNQKDPRQHHWYYRSIACALESLEDTPAWREYDWLIGQVFEEGDEGPSPGRPEETAKEEE